MVSTSLLTTSADPSLTWSFTTTPSVDSFTWADFNGYRYGIDKDGTMIRISEEEIAMKPKRPKKLNFLN